MSTKYLNRTMPVPGRIVHCNTKFPDGSMTPCRPAIVTGIDSNTLFATQFAPNLAPMQIILRRDSDKWHEWTECPQPNRLSEEESKYNDVLADL